MTELPLKACAAPPDGLLADTAQRFAALVPVLATERLILRAPRVEDAALYVAIASGPRGVGLGGPMIIDEAWYDFAALAAGWMLHGHGGWSVERRDTGTLIGFVILGLEPGDQEPELGYLVAEDYEGHGYATEAAIAARDYAFGTLGMPTLVSYILKGNSRSVALAERLGATLDGEIRYDGDDVASLVYRHPAPAFQTKGEPH